MLGLSVPGAVTGTLDSEMLSWLLRPSEGLACEWKRWYCGGYGEGRKAVGKRRDVKSWTMRRQPENSRGEVKGQCCGLLF